MFSVLLFKKVIFTPTSYLVIFPLGHSGGLHVKVTQLALFANKVTDLGAFCGPIKITCAIQLFFLIGSSGLLKIHLDGSLRDSLFVY